MVHVITNVLERLSDCHKSRGARLSVSVYWQNARKVQRTKNNERIIRRRAHSRIPLRCTPCDTRIHDAPLTFDLFRSVSLFLNVDRPAFHLPTLGWRVETRGCFFISRVESRLSTLQMKKRVGGSRDWVGSSPRNSHTNPACMRKTTLPRF